MPPEKLRYFAGIMVEAGLYHTLPVLRILPIGAILDDGEQGLLLPKRFVPAGLKTGDPIRVFVYHDGEDRPVATTQEPLGIAGEIVLLRCVSVNNQGAFLDWGLMKDLFVPRSQQRNRMIPHGHYLVHLFRDPRTGRMAATEKFDSVLSNEVLTVAEKDAVQLTVLRRTDIGFLMIINHRHTGVLHNNEVFRSLSTGDRLNGFIKKIDPVKKTIDVVAGEKGYARVDPTATALLETLKDHAGFLPLHDRTDPETIYDMLGISKKTFKMAVGQLYKQRLIQIHPDGIRIAPTEPTDGTHQS
jgi:predicted RNA-binding protein (virulence factor B family)